MRIQNHLAERRIISIEIKIQSHRGEVVGPGIEIAALASPRRIRKIRDLQMEEVDRVHLL